MKCPGCQQLVDREYSARCWTCHSAPICTTCAARHAKRYQDHKTSWAYVRDTPVLATNLDRREGS